MESKPFPYVLVALAAALGWATVAGENGWIRVATGLATLFVMAAAVYQSAPDREPPGPPEDDEP